MFNIERMVNQTLWFAIMTDPYQGDNYFENDTFAIKPYSWSDDDINDWHFYHKPSGLKLQWYKYPLRGVMSNIDITHEQFYAVLKDCMNSVASNNFKDATFIEWWQ